MTTKKTKKVKPIIVDEISSEKIDMKGYFEKRIIKGGVPALNLAEGHVRVIILKGCEGMTGYYYEGDIIDLPERRFKSLRLRGLIDEYKGNKGVTRER